MTAEPKLLTRDQFREQVFVRDRCRCVFCGAPAVDAHHIMERRLYPDGGYYLDNGASVCADHHLACEMTTISTEEVRRAARIQNIVLPPHLYADAEYDKWGNIVMPSGGRIMGELFQDESVQKILGQGGVLHLFGSKVKYPRTHHVPFSPGLTDDDRVLGSYEAFIGERVIVTEKMDGENTTLYSDGLHARSVDSRNHESRNWVKTFHARICGDIPEHWRLCGENLFAEHSIAYTDLQSYFYGFSMWDGRNNCLAWDDTLEWFQLLGVQSVPVLYDGLFDEKLLQSLHAPVRNGRPSEGWVLRTAKGFGYGQFRTHMAKYVREGHVQTVKHWMHGQPVRPNLLTPGVATW